MKRKILGAVLWFVSLVVSALLYLYFKLLGMGEYATGEGPNEEKSN